jgi:NAD(P)-dependent dehydrogenase (short-subunit alcohol dehydrogenase family)
MSNIVITGASRGIGLATALELARAGHQVVATMRNPAGSPELGQQAAKENLPIRIETMDVDSDESVKQAFGRILAQGAVDVLVNNAGIERMGAIEETPLDDFRTCMETNYFGAIRCIQAVIRPMRERGSGAIINVTSVAGKISLSPLGPYSASKFALEAVSEVLAQELRAFGVRVALSSPALSIRGWPAISRAWGARKCIRKFGGARPCSRGRWRPERASHRWWAKKFGRW